ncbi:unnamed protein product [Chilo suppressalis]|uniref:Uncharacterized protein n=1 Tax=Chilo suppressalis TaxID=168631 RepID=A0ABN8B5D2_CHISP|nr:hypothetical protein evm_008619 [Chilo suppressalis]CAH0403839.1 unnamed protein product [Chilo suppressalis]
MNLSKKGPVFEGGTCRCCGIIKKCRLLNAEYEFYGQKEVYIEMFVDCFGVVLSHLEGEEKDRLICATCVLRLRDACAFRQQVLQWEELLLKQQMQVDDESNKITSNDTVVEIKVEIEDYIPQQDGDSYSHPEDENNEFICEPDVKVLLKEEMDVAESQLVTRQGTKRRLSQETLKAKKEMLLKMKKMREKLEEIQEAEAVPIAADSTPPLAPAGKWKSANTKAFHNIITLVENSYVCPFGSTFSNYLCIYCREMFTDPEKLRQHTLTHDPKVYQDTVAYKRDLQIDIARIDCRLCPASIDNLDAFYKHVTQVHDKTLYPNIKNEFLKFVLRAGNLSCLECGTNYTNYHALKRHMAEHFGTCICDICGVHFFEENKLVVHQKCHRDKSNNRFPCKECGKLFKSKHGMYYHVSRAHSAEPTFHCYKCDEMLFSQTLRYRHMIEVHGETARKFPCDNCNKVYDTRKSLREHNRKAHLRVFRHECKVCKRKFYLPSALKDHMASHSAERNYRCEYCGKSYPRLRALKVHMQSHETEKKYKCHICSASYTQGNNLKNHMKTKHDCDYNDDVGEQSDFQP